MLSPGRTLSFLVALLAAGCSAHTTARFPGNIPHPPVAHVATPAASPEPVRQPDLAAELIAVSTLHFEAGQRELELGHLGAAKDHFNKALEVLLESPFGGRTESRVRDHFDQLVERISGYEVTALAQGDGFAEQGYESATIDQILAVSTFDIPAPTVATTQAVTADLQTSVHDIEIPLNAKVLSFVELFTGRLKAYLEEGLSRGMQFLPMIQDVFRAEGLPLDLAYIPLVESAFKPSALSRAKAKGMWQFMHGTALENGLAHDWYIDERAEPEKATRAAAKYLKTLNGMFDGDWHLALASYNGGPGRVQRAVKRSGRSDFWELTASSRYLPRETRDYVPLILAAIIIARNPAQYGMNVQPFVQPPTEVVTLSAAVDLRRIAEWLDMPVQTLQDINPELRRWTTPVRASDYELKVPGGTGDIVRAHLAETDSSELAPLNWHTVTKGETLTTIAKKLKVSRTDLAEANYLSSKAQVALGQQLIIPRAPALLAARTDNPAPDTESRQVDAELVSKAAPKAPEPGQASLVYRVKRGDTLFSIARLYQTTVASLKTWNRLRTNSIQVGQRLTIFAERTATATN